MADENIDVRLRLQGAREFITGTDKAAGAVQHIGTQSRRTAAQQTAMGRRMNQVTGQATRHASALRRAAGAAVGLGAAYVGISQVKSAVTATTDLAKTTMGLNKSFNLSIPQASRFAAVLKARGVDSKQTTMAFSTLAKQIVAAQGGTKAAVKNFQTLGLSTKDLSKAGTDWNSILMQTADALHNHQHDYRAAAAARTLFGRGFQSMVPLLRQGSVALQENLRQADKYGVTLNSKTIGPIMQLVHQQREMKVATLGLKVQLGQALIPTINKLAGAGTKLFAIFNQKGLSPDQKWARADRIINPLIASFEKGIERAAPQIASHAGSLGIAMAKGMIRGFFHADPLGQAVILGVLGKKLGVFSLLGSMAGKRFGSGFSRTPITPPIPATVPGGTPRGGPLAPLGGPRGGGTGIRVFTGEGGPKGFGGPRGGGAGGLAATIGFALASMLIPPNAKGPGNMPIVGGDDITRTGVGRRLRQDTHGAQTKGPFWDRKTVFPGVATASTSLTKAFHGIAGFAGPLSQNFKGAASSAAAGRHALNLLGLNISGNNRVLPGLRSAWSALTGSSTGLSSSMRLTKHELDKVIPKIPGLANVPGLTPDSPDSTDPSAKRKKRAAGRTPSTQGTGPTKFELPALVPLGDGVFTLEATLINQLDGQKLSESTTRHAVRRRARR